MAGGEQHPAAQVPPQNIDAEESVLGALMLLAPDSATFGAVLDTGLQPGDFYYASHGLTYRTMLDLRAEGVPPDHIALVDRLERNGKLADVGGRQRLHEIAALVPVSANAAHWARIVRDLAERRLVVRIGQEITGIGNDPIGATDPLEHARELVERAARNGSLTTPVRVVPFDEFTSVTEDTAEPLLGTPEETLLPADGMLLMYGDGGAGKTTLSIDALAHLASGTDWLGTPITHAARVLLIENEGPRGPFRRRLARKRDHWQGDPFAQNVSVLEEPWTRFTLNDPAYRRGLAQEIDRTESDLVIVGPLASLGAKGTGTPDDVNEFGAVLADLRARADRRFALWIVHHENKAGDVSGAWERVPDTLVHVSAQGNGRTRVHWLKVRWSSALHNTSLTLHWTDGSGFKAEERTDRDLYTETKDFLLKHPRSATVDVVAGVEARKQVVTKLLKTNEDFTFEEGERGAHLWSFRNSGNTSEQLDLHEAAGSRSGGALSGGEHHQGTDQLAGVPPPGTTDAPEEPAW